METLSLIAALFALLLSSWSALTARSAASTAIQAEERRRSLSDLPLQWENYKMQLTKLLGRLDKHAGLDRSLGTPERTGGEEDEPDHLPPPAPSQQFSRLALLSRGSR